VTVWTGSSYVYFGVQGPLADVLEEFRYEFDDPFHITIAFLGREPLPGFVSARALGIVRKYAAEIDKIELAPTKFATFGPPTAPARVCKFGVPPGLLEWRNLFCKALDNVGATISRNYEPWEPHLTYSYGFPLEELTYIEGRILGFQQRYQLTLKTVEMVDGRARLIVPLE
jgi:2'-5' RNA ligase